MEEVTQLTLFFSRGQDRNYGKCRLGLIPRRHRMIVSLDVVQYEFLDVFLFIAAKEEDMGIHTHYMNFNKNLAGRKYFVLYCWHRL